MLNISIHHWAIWCWYRIVWPGAIHIEPCYTNLHVQCVYYYYLSIVQRKIHAPTDQYKINRQHEHDVLWNVHDVSIFWYEKNEKVEKKTAIYRNQTTANRASTLFSAIKMFDDFPVGFFWCGCGISSGQCTNYRRMQRWYLELKRNLRWCSSLP